MKNASEQVQSSEQRIARLEKYINKVETAIQVLQQNIRDGKTSPLTEEQIRFHLTNDPNLIAEAGIELAHFRRAYEYAKVDVKLIQAKIWKQINQKRNELNLTSAKDRDAYVATHPEYVEAVRQEIEWRYNLERMQTIYDRYENLFTGTRKLASMLVQEKTNYDQGV